MIINALNSGANVFLADLEDSLTPTWGNVVEGQINLRDAVRRTISFDSPEGKHYALNQTTAVLFVRPRGWHLPEKHFLVGRNRVRMQRNAGIQMHDAFRAEAEGLLVDGVILRTQEVE